MAIPEPLDKLKQEFQKEVENHWGVNYPQALQRLKAKGEWTPLVDEEFQSLVAMVEQLMKDGMTYQAALPLAKEANNLYQSYPTENPLPPTQELI
jgi:hypothetical protein